MTQILDAALLYTALGWHVLPLFKNSKLPATPNGTKGASNDESQIRAWFENPKCEYNIGILAGEKSGIVVFDIDPRNGGDQSWDDWLTENGGEPLQGEYCLQYTAGGGRHYIAKWQPGMFSRKLRPGVDFLSNGLQIVAYPSTIDGKQYQWADDCNPFEGTFPMTVSHTWADSIIAPRIEKSESLAGGVIIKGDRNSGLTQLAGYMRAGGMSEAEIFAALTVTNELRCESPLPVSEVKTISHSVSRYAPDSEIATDAALGSYSADMLFEHLESEKRTGYFLTRATSFLGQPAPVPWLVRGWVPENGTTMIFGESGIGKTFVAIDMACSIAAGLQWAGQKTKTGTVVYLAGEGNWGLRQRVAAWCQYHGVTELDNLLISNKPIDIDSPACAMDVLRAIKDLVEPAQVVNVFIDTLNRHMSGDENSAKDMRNMLNACGVVSAETGGAITLIHHTGYGGAAKERERGSSALRGAMDASLLVVKDGETIKVECKKMKEAREPEPLFFTIADVDLGWIDDDGNPEPPAGVVTIGEKPIQQNEEKASKTKLSENALRGRAAFRASCHSKGRRNEEGQFDGVSELFWRDEFYMLCGDISPATKRQNWGRAKKNLMDAGEVIEIDGYYYPHEMSDDYIILNQS